uniref:Uncharacterized protein n=1 Tax=viral metagenome TaxID=1070528 RepID=A0A6C0KCN9_9ZZZZ
MPSPKSKDFFQLSKKKQGNVLIEWILLQAFITYINMRKAAVAKKSRARVGRTISLFGAATTRSSAKSKSKSKSATKKRSTAKKTPAKKSSNDVADTDHIIQRLVNVVRESPTSLVTLGSLAANHAGTSAMMTHGEILKILKKDSGMRKAVGEIIDSIKDGLTKTKYAVTTNSEIAREQVVTLTHVLERFSNSDPQLGQWAVQTMTPHMRTVNNMLGVGGTFVKATSAAAVRATTHYVAPAAAGIGAVGISMHLVWQLLPQIHRLVRANSSVTLFAATGAAFMYQDNGYGPEARHLVESTIQRGGTILGNNLLTRTTGLVAPYAIPRSGSPPQRGFWAPQRRPTQRMLT